MFIELHLIQNFAPSNLNRDDTNSPKDCTFGGHRRARISSQCFKRAIRESPVFKEAVGGRVGVRTKLLCEQIVAGLGRPVEEARGVVALALAEAGYKVEDGKTAVLLFVSPGEIGKYAEIIGARYDTILSQIKANVGKKTPKYDLGDLKKALAGLGSRTEAADIALFGRMVAETTNMNVDAACQVAQAISTHPVAVEMDFYTAVDDLQPKEETGAGMMGVIEYNSACFYRYAVVKVEDLQQNLGGDRESAVQAAIGFCKAAVAAIPTGKQNSMAAHNPPSYIQVKLRDGGQPWSLANAFVEPARVTAKAPDLVRASIDKLRAYDKSLAETYGVEGVKLDLAASTYPELRDHSAPELWAALAKALG